eukprot:TRINITY_DN4064_c0_g1_i1.p1 TRINITY_DN4064_c0_g1~~TRINITY_DN4064_c0_g1_i1.p1  ORF type:complete len:232 (-),score=35.59 TRINITY_DN4064_c0_g1_i1:48-650(-)
MGSCYSKKCHIANKYQRWKKNRTKKKKRQAPAPPYREISTATVINEESEDDESALLSPGSRGLGASFAEQITPIEETSKTITSKGAPIVPVPQENVTRMLWQQDQDLEKSKGFLSSPSDTTTSAQSTPVKGFPKSLQNKVGQIESPLTPSLDAIFADPELADITADFSGTTVEVDGMEVPEELAPYLRELESEDEEAVEV